MSQGDPKKKKLFFVAFVALHGKNVARRQKWFFARGAFFFPKAQIMDLCHGKKNLLLRAGAGDKKNPCRATKATKATKNNFFFFCRPATFFRVVQLLRPFHLAVKGKRQKRTFFAVLPFTARTSLHLGGKRHKCLEKFPLFFTFCFYQAEKGKTRPHFLPGKNWW